MTKDSEITKVQVIIRRFLWETRNVVKTPEESQRWLSKFRNTLEFQDLEELPSEYAMLLLAEAKSFNNTKKRNAQMKWVRDSLVREGIKRPTQDQLDERWLEMYGNEENNADGDIRKDSQNRKSGTSATPYAGAPNGNNGDVSATACDHFEARQSQNATEDAATREGAVNMTRTSNGATLESGTSSVAKFNDKNMRRVPQNEAPAHGFSGGRTAQGTMSRSPEAAAQSGKVYDQETIEISTNDGRRTGVPSLSQTSSLAPVRHSSTAKSGDVLSMAYSGEFSNVVLTQEQYNELGIKFGNLQKLNRAIDSLSCKLENDEITPRPKNHYAVLDKWASYRDDMEEKKELEESKPKMTNM